MRLFTYRMYVMATIVGAMFGAGMFGSIYLAPILAQLVHSYSATDAGIMLLPGGIVAMLTFPIAGRLSQRVSPSILMPVGLILFAISNWWLASSSMETAFWTLAWMIAFGRIGLGIVMPALNYSALSAVPPELVPYASGTLNFVRMTGAAIGVNALAITLDVRFGGAIKSLAAMQTSANEATRAAMLDLSALFASGGLPASASNTAAMSYLRDLLSLKALEASFQTAFLVLALGFVVAAIAAAILMREPRPKSH
jgi:predicted MFS family arabinose efflux permease